MTTSVSTTAEPVSIAAQPSRAKARYLFSPFIDFICLGGSSLILIPLMLLHPPEQYQATIAFGTLILANLLNHPHFAHSYQIFYRSFRAKCFSSDYKTSLRVRYAIAGVLVPCALGVFFMYAIAQGNAPLLGFAANIMAFFVGWHYVKQGYGMLMLDAVLKSCPFKIEEKRIFLVNSYAVWVVSWLKANVAMKGLDLWGIKYYTFEIPVPLLTVASAIAVLTTGATVIALVRRWYLGGRLPINGVVGYCVSVYLWLLLVRFNPLWIFVVPAMHSLQYMIVVYRFELNASREKGAVESSALMKFFKDATHWRMAMFSALGLVLGFLGFWLVPVAIDSMGFYDREVFGSYLFVFVFWTAINIHHYFMDNVMWRRDNPDIRRHLFTDPGRHIH